MSVCPAFSRVLLRQNAFIVANRLNILFSTIWSALFRGSRFPKAAILKKESWCSSSYMRPWNNNPAHPSHQVLFLDSSILAQSEELPGTKLTL
jgi:hypothetical protein